MVMSGDRERDYGEGYDSTTGGSIDGPTQVRRKVNSSSSYSGSASTANGEKAKRRRTAIRRRWWRELQWNWPPGE